MAIMDEADALKTARDEGRQEAEVIGMEKVAKNLLAQGIIFSIITAATGLNEKELLSLQEK